MKIKIILITSIIAMMVLISTISTYASGWLPVNQSTQSPHNGLSSSSNLCKYCHAVHDANSQSYRLLHNDSRVNECNYCHLGLSGLSSKKVYTSTENTVSAAHLIEADTRIYPKLKDENNNQRVPLIEGNPIPDSNKLIPNRTGTNNGKFNCYHCHSVHGANIVTGSLAAKILRTDPAKDGIAKEISNETEYCLDCHNLNESNSNHIGRSHPLTSELIDLDVYGSSMRISWVGTASCGSCHRATGLPHESPGYKFLNDDTLNIELDNVCLSCHINPANYDEGVSLSY